VKSALTRYRLLAYTTGVFLLLLTANVIVKYVLDRGGLGDWLAITHGWLYMVYVAVTIDLWSRTKLPIRRTVLVVLAGTVPFMSFVAERWVRSQVQPMIERAAPAAPVGQH
jgi:integral membrane protein